jgi:hypothetical protein
MSSLTISLIAFVFILGGALLGLLLGAILPKHHLSDHSKDSIKIGAGLIATLTALVLGLLVSSAKSSFDAMNDEIKQGSATLILLDHVLIKYGPEAKPAREMLRNNLIFVLEKVWPTEKNQKVSLQAVEKASGIEAVYEKIQELRPQNDKKRALQAKGLELCGELAHMRWLVIEQAESSLPLPFIGVLVFWLSIFFVSFGLLAPRNGTVIAVMIVCTLSVAGAIFLIMEMNSPLDGMIKVSSAPFRKALVHLSQ